MLPFGVTIPATVPQRSEIPEGLTNYPVLKWIFRVRRLLKEWNVDCVKVDRNVLFKTTQYLYSKQFPYHLKMSGTGCHINCVCVQDVY